MTDTITITDLADLRVGDWAVFEYVVDRGNSVRVEGEVYGDGDMLNLGNMWVRGSRGGSAPHARFIEARRPKPDPPTELSLIRAMVDEESLVLIGPDFDGDWRGIGTGYYTPDKIGDFEILWTEDA